MPIKLQFPVKFILAIALALHSFCAFSADGKRVAVVNEKPLFESELESFIALRHGQNEVDKKQREEMLNQLINRELIYQEAVNKEFHKGENIVRLIKEQEKNLISQYFLEQQVSENSISERALKRLYKSEIEDRAGFEYKARHILVEDQEVADKIIVQLKEGEEFSGLASKFSVGPSASLGGDLGWFTLNQMSENFANGITQLKVGEYSGRPVNSEFGWHVILLEDKRPVPVPGLEHTKPQLTKLLQRRYIADYINELRKNAEVKTEN